MLSVNGKNGMHMILLGNLLLKCFLQQSQYIQPYINNQIKEIKKRCFFQRISHSIYYCGTTRVYQTKVKGRERNCMSNQFFNCRSEKQSLLAFNEEGVFDCKSMLRGLPHPLLGIPWGNMTFHVSELWHGKINEKRGVWKFLSIFSLFCSARKYLCPPQGWSLEIFF